MWVAERGNLDAVRLLVTKGANVNAVNNHGDTVLTRGAQSGNADVVQLLVQSGADVGAMDVNKIAALVAGAWNCYWDVFRFLLECRANVNAAGDRGHAGLILMCAAESANPEIARLLIENGANVDGVDNRGETALMRALKNGVESVARILLGNGAEVNRVNHDGLSAVFFAMDRGDIALQRLLLQHVQRTPHAVGLMQATHTTATTPMTTRAASSWFIPPSEVELQNFLDTQNVGGEYRAKWLDADVVAKLFVPGGSPSSFAEEVTVWHQLRHPNVIKLYGASGGGLNFFVCEFASNGSVAKYLRRFRRKGVQRRAWKLMLDAALGLAHLHERKIVHGNFRGSNILVGSDSLAKLSDFGLSAAVGTTKATSSWSGIEPMRWQSPERLAGGEASFASDIYSLGMCIVEAVTGEIPWVNCSRAMIWDGKTAWDPASDLSNPGPRPWDWRVEDKISRNLRFLTSKMCAKDPHKRVPASSVVQILEGIAVAQRTRQTTIQSIHQYKGGDLTRLWNKVNSVKQLEVNDLQQEVLRDLQELYDRLA